MVKPIIKLESNIKPGDEVLHRWWCLTRSETKLVWSKVESLSVYWDNGEPYITVTVRSKTNSMSCTLNVIDIKKVK